MFEFLKNIFRFDGIQDSELSPNSDGIWLTPMERLGVQSMGDAELARKLIAERKAAAKQKSQDKE